MSVYSLCTFIVGLLWIAFLFWLDIIFPSSGPIAMFITMPVLLLTRKLLERIESNRSVNTPEPKE